VSHTNLANDYATVTCMPRTHTFPHPHLVLGDPINLSHARFLLRLIAMGRDREWYFKKLFLSMEGIDSVNRTRAGRSLSKSREDSEYGLN
jgi:hypothetical protein